MFVCVKERDRDRERGGERESHAVPVFERKPTRTLIFNAVLKKPVIWDINWAEYQVGQKLQLSFKSSCV